MPKKDTTQLPPSFWVGMPEIAHDMDCSRGYVYELMNNDPDFPPWTYFGNRRKCARHQMDAYYRKRLARQNPDAPRRGRPPKVAPVQATIEN